MHRKRQTSRKGDIIQSMYRLWDDMLLGDEIRCGFCCFQCRILPL